MSAPYIALPGRPIARDPWRPREHIKGGLIFIENRGRETSMGGYVVRPATLADRWRVDGGRLASSMGDWYVKHRYQVEGVTIILGAFAVLVVAMIVLGAIINGISATLGLH